MSIDLSASVTMTNDTIVVAVSIVNHTSSAAFARNLYIPDNGSTLTYEINPHLVARLPRSELSATRRAAAVWLRAPGVVALFQGYTHHFFTGPRPFQWLGPAYSRIEPGAISRYEIVQSRPMQEWEKNWIPEKMLAPVLVRRLDLRVELAEGGRPTEVDGRPGVWTVQGGNPSFLDASIELPEPAEFRGFDPAAAFQFDPDAMPMMGGPVKRVAGQPPHRF